MPAFCPRIAASASASSSSRPALAPARAPRAPAGRFPPFPPPARFATPTRAQLGEPSKQPSSSPSKGTPGAPPPAGGGGKEKEKAGADAEQAASDAAAAAEAYVDGVARVAEEGISSAGDVVYAARADAIAAERKAAEGEALSEDDIRRLAALRRSGASAAGAASPADSGGLLAGVLEEARLIEWPTFGRAVGDTAVVLAIVAVSAAVMFVINTGLTEFSTWIYG